MHTDSQHRRITHLEFKYEGETEEGFIMPLRELVSRGYTRAEELLQLYRTDWGRDFAPLFRDFNYL